jgi:hypothetical protein
MPPLGSRLKRLGNRLQIKRASPRVRELLLLYVLHACTQKAIRLTQIAWIIFGPKT